MATLPVARRRARSDEVLAFDAASLGLDPEPCAPRKTAVACRARLPGDEARDRPRPLRRPNLARLPPSCRPLCGRTCLPRPSPGAFSPGGGLAGRCRRSADTFSRPSCVGSGPVPYAAAPCRPALPRRGSRECDRVVLEWCTQRTTFRGSRQTPARVTETGAGVLRDRLQRGGSWLSSIRRARSSRDTEPDNAAPRRARERFGDETCEVELVLLGGCDGPPYDRARAEEVRRTPRRGMVPKGVPGALCARRWQVQGWVVTRDVSGRASTLWGHAKGEKQPATVPGVSTKSCQLGRARGLGVAVLRKATKPVQIERPVRSDFAIADLVRFLDEGRAEAGAPHHRPGRLGPCIQGPCPTTSRSSGVRREDFAANSRSPSRLERGTAPPEVSSVSATASGLSSMSSSRARHPRQACIARVPRRRQSGSASRRTRGVRVERCQRPGPRTQRSGRPRLAAPVCRMLACPPPWRAPRDRHPVEPVTAFVPASAYLQQRDEMQNSFALLLEFCSRCFVARHDQERGARSDLRNDARLVGDTASPRIPRAIRRSAPRSRAPIPNAAKHSPPSRPVLSRHPFDSRIAKLTRYA